jgi:hypothetical protein
MMFVIKSTEKFVTNKDCHKLKTRQDLNLHRHQVNLAIFFFYSGLRGYWHFGHSWPIVPASGDNEDDCGEADGM